MLVVSDGDIAERESEAGGVLIGDASACCQQLWSLFFFKQKTAYEIGLGIPAEPLFRSHEYPFLYQRQTCHQVQPNQATYQKRQKCQPATYLQEVLYQL